MNDTWILVANGSRAHVLATDTPRQLDHDDRVTEVACFEHPESREKRSELVSDNVGRNAPGGGHAGASGGDFVERGDVKEHEKELFARDLVAVLHKAQQDKKFKRLVLVMPAAFYGKFKPLMADALQKVVLLHIGKDYSGLAKHELRVQLMEQLRLE